MLGMSGCAKYTSDCEVVIRPRVLRVQSSPSSGEAAYMVKVYAYYISEDDIENWAPASYADAESGFIRHKISGETRRSGFMREQPDYDDGALDEDTYIRFTFSNSPIFLVAVDPVNKFYAWRELEYKVPLDRLTIVLRFQLWKNAEQYKDSEWYISSENFDNLAETEESED